MLWESHGSGILSYLEAGLVELSPDQKTVIAIKDYYVSTTLCWPSSSTSENSTSPASKSESH